MYWSVSAIMQVPAGVCMDTALQQLLYRRNNHLYEFDCGNESGWMYKVNGWFPNYGCSSYYLEDGDVIVWTYSCKGLGADVGGGVG